jgi:hypothetical protein
MKHIHAPFPAQQTLPAILMVLKTKWNFMTSSFIVIRFYIQLSLLVCCQFYATFKMAGKIGVTNSKSRGNK